MPKELNMCTFGYNNSNLTIQLIESLEKFYNLQDYNFTIADNSTTSNGDYEIAIQKNLKYFDNRENKFGENKGWINYQSHGQLLQYMLNITTSKYLIIFDTDVIVKKDFMNLFEEFKKSGKIAAGYICHTHQWCQPRLHPFFNIFDIEQLHNKNIKYRIKGVSAETGDTGAEFYSNNKNDILLLGNLVNRDGSFDNAYFYHYCGKVIKNK